MRVTAISDLHGATEHLGAAGRGCDILLVLGDLINVLDYRTWDGILVEVFGREPVVEAARLRAEGRFAEAREEFRRRVGDGIEFRERFAGLARQQYERVFAAMPAHSYVTYGNVDVPQILHEVLPGEVRFVDGEVVTIGGWRFGFVGGGVRTPLGIPGEVADYDATFERLGSADVICTHMPPRLPWYCYDVVAHKFEPGSVGLLEYVQGHRPRLALFGHVHQPLVGRGTVGATELVNVGHFQAHGQGFSFEVPDDGEGGHG